MDYFFKILVISLVSCLSLAVLFFNALVLPRPCWLSLAYLEWVYKGYFIISEAIIRMWFPNSYNKMLLLLAPTICYICRTLLTLNHQSCIVPLKYLFISYSRWELVACEKSLQRVSKYHGISKKVTYRNCGMCHRSYLLCLYKVDVRSESDVPDTTTQHTDKCPAVSY